MELLMVPTSESSHGEVSRHNYCSPWWLEVLSTYELSYRTKVFIVLYTSTLFVMGDGQAHAILMRREAKKAVWPALWFSRNGKPSYLAALTRDEGPMCVIPSTPPMELAPWRKWGTCKARCKHIKGQHGEKNASCPSNQMKGHFLGTRCSRIEHTKTPRQGGRCSIGRGTMSRVKFPKTSTMFQDV